LDRAGGTVDNMPALHAMRVQCHWRLDDPSGTFGALAEAERKFPDRADFTRQRLHYLLRLGLYLEASRAGRAYLERAGASPEAYVTLGEALRRSLQLDEALNVLERGRLQYRWDERILVSLANAYLDKGLPRAAARILEEASALYAKYLPEAAELYCRGNELRRALYLNAQVPDQKVKTRQRLGILLDAGRFEEAAALESRLQRLGFFEDEDIRYALAYVRYRTGDYDGAEGHLQSIRRADLFQAAAELRRAIEVAKKHHE
jgi:tetratricopeptide (TPR) repeat protein